MKYDVAIIGAGPGGIFSAYELTKLAPSLRVAVFEAGHSLEKRHCPIDGKKVKSCIGCKSCSIMSGFGGSGAFSDGKYNITNDFGGTHEITFSRECWIEADDFMAEPILKYKRLFPGGPECRLKGAYLIKCVGYETDENGNVTEIAAEYDPDSRGGDPADGRKVKGATLHWVDAATAIDAEVRVYSELFSDPAPDGADKDFLACMNPDSLETLTGCKVEARMRDVAAEYDKTEKQGKTAPSFQFMRLGYFCLDNKDCSADHLVFNRSVTLKDSFKV